MCLNELTPDKASLGIFSPSFTEEECTETEPWFKMKYNVSGKSIVLVSIYVS